MKRHSAVGLLVSLLMLVPSPADAQAATMDTSRVTDAQIAESVHDLILPVHDLVLKVESTDNSLSDEQTPSTRILTLAADVFFPFGSAELNQTSAARVADVAAATKAGTGKVFIDGYTDAVGDDDANLALSQRRAEAVRAVLSPTLPGAIFEVRGRGEADPVEPNTINGQDNPAGRAKNRRVTVTVAAS